MPTLTYQERRGQIETYFDRTAAETWKRLTSDAPVSKIRATVRAGRDQMRATLLNWMPDDLTGRRLLDAGCGTGALSIEAARRGADVVAIDVAGELVEMARQRTPNDLGNGRVSFHVGDMLDPALGRFDHIVAMDSLIHYQADDAIRVLTELARRTNASMLFTFAPSNPLLATMWTVGRLFPRSDRAPSIVPIRAEVFRRRLAKEPGLSAFTVGRTLRIKSGFYTSQAQELKIS